MPTRMRRSGLTLADCRRTLQVAAFAPWEDVRRSYRTLAKQYHPDMNAGDPARAAQFRRIAAAFKALEAHYRNNPPPVADTRNPAGADDTGTPRAAPASSIQETAAEYATETVYEAQPVDDTAGMAADTDADAVEAPGSGASWRDFLKKTTLRWEDKLLDLDLYQRLTVDAELAAGGGVVRIRTPEESFYVRLPPGIENLMELRVARKGLKSLIYDDARGDLRLKMRVTPAKNAASGSANIFYEMRVAREEIASGKVLTLNTFQGPIKFFVPRRTADGEAFVLKAGTGSAWRVNHIVTLRLTGAD